MLIRSSIRWLLLMAMPLSACGPSSKDLEGLSPAGRRGLQVYRANCTACHHRDPHKAGSQGPELAGASRALLEARIMRAAYPQDYRPKRTTKLMPKQPWLAPRIGDLAAYLHEVVKRK